MKLLLIGDMHLQSSKFELAKSFLYWIKTQVEELQPDLVVNLGDTMHNHSVLRAEILGEYKKHLIDITALCPYIHILGNHEMWKPTDSTYHALQAFAGMENLIIADKIIHNKSAGISFVPYQPDHSKFPKKTLPICIAHQTFVGADFGSYRPDDGVDADSIENEIIISGHIHGRQMFGKVIYPGTPFAQGLDDANKSKGIMIFDTETYKYSFIESPFPRWYSLSFEIGQDLNFQQLHEELVNTLTEGDNWVIDISGQKNEIAAYMDSKEFNELKKGKLIRIRPIYTNLIKNDRVKINAVSMQDILGEYISKVYDGVLDKDLLREETIRILNDINVLDV